MAINFVRQPSETPNVRNIDDIVPFRYAYGNQNGYVKDKGNELSYTVNGSNFRINSGRVVLFGVESDIDANGVIVTVPNVATTRYYSVYYHVNLATNTTSIESTYGETGYPTIPTGDDLTANTSGSANLELYRFVALNGTISNVAKVVNVLKYSQPQLDELYNQFESNNPAVFGYNFIGKYKKIYSGSATTVDLSNYNLTSGTKLLVVFGASVKKTMIIKYGESNVQTEMYDLGTSLRFRQYYLNASNNTLSSSAKSDALLSIAVSTGGNVTLGNRHTSGNATFDVNIYEVWQIID